MDAETEKKTGQQVCTQKYARADLFRLASRVASQDGAFLKQLKAFEEADKSGYNLDKLACGSQHQQQQKFASNGQVTFAGKPFKLVRSVSNFSRPSNNSSRANLVDNNKQRVNNNNSNQTFLARGGANEPATKRLSRMTSSPSIGYTKQASRVVAKDTNRPSAGAAATKVPGLTRPFEASDEDAARRTNTDYKKPPKRHSSFSRGNSIEVGKTPGADTGCGSPIKRIISSTTTTTDEPANGEEDDNFELTSLVSITVLSDIKTIRQDLLQGSADCGAGQSARQQVAAAAGRAKGRFKRPSRSNSSMEFTHHGRTLNAAAAAAAANPLARLELGPKTAECPSRRLAQAAYDATAPTLVQPSPDLYYPSHTSYDTGDQPESLMAFQYDWDTLRAFDITASSAQVNPRYQASGRLLTTARPTAKPLVVDESAELIRERFMAEVKARAERQSATTEAAADQHQHHQHQQQQQPATSDKTRGAVGLSSIPRLQAAQVPSPAGAAAKLASGIPRLVALGKVKTTTTKDLPAVVVGKK